MAALIFSFVVNAIGWAYVVSYSMLYASIAVALLLAVRGIVTGR